MSNSAAKADSCWRGHCRHNSMNRRDVGDTPADPCVMLERVIVTFDAALWIWDARKADSWTFLSVPADLSEEIKELSDGPRRGFGSVRARITIGASTWTTSIFPDSKRACYVLPIKQAVRRAEAIEAGDVITVTVEVLDLR